MKIFIAKSPSQLGEMAAKKAAKLIRSAISERNTANIIVATGGSQIEMLNCLVREDIDWKKVVVFHLDDYFDLPESSPASFRYYIKKQLLEKVGQVQAAHLINGNADPEAECEKLKQIIEQHSIDVALVGIGENGHLAFNGPPADFHNIQPYILVNWTKSAVCNKWEKVGSKHFTMYRQRLSVFRFNNM